MRKSYTRGMNEVEDRNERIAKLSTVYGSVKAASDRKAARLAFASSSDNGFLSIFRLHQVLHLGTSGRRLIHIHNIPRLNDPR